MIKWIWLVALTTKIAAASYAPVPNVDIDIEESRKDKSLVQLAYSKPAHDNVGLLFRKTPIINTLDREGSVNYIGRRLCLTAAHCAHFEDFDYEVVFEKQHQKTKSYKVERCIQHPEREKHSRYDISILILSEPVEELDGLKINFDFSKQQTFEDYQHLLTYVGYGKKHYENGWLCIDDNRRRAIQAHTFCCSITQKNFGIYSSLYLQDNKSKASREPIHYETFSREGMSGGAVLNNNDELVSVISGINHPYLSFWGNAYLYIANFINIFPVCISSCCCSCPLLVTTYISPGQRMRSVPLGACREWIESVRRQYGEDAHTV